MADLDTVTLPVLPLTDDVVLPGMVVTLALETSEARAAADAAAKAGNTILLVPRQGDGRYARVGTVARIENRGQLPGGVAALVIRATVRAEVGLGVIGETSGLWVHASPVDDGELSEEAEATATELRAALRALFQALGGRRLTEVLRGVDEPSALADLVGWWPDLAVERKVELLETLDLGERLRLVLGWVKDALAEHELAEKIRNDVSEGLEGRQREFLLRQQMDAIRKELGEDGDDDSLTGYRERLTALVEAGAVPEATRKAIEREIDRFERTPEQNIEHGWIRNWLDTVFEIPWGERSVDDYDIARAREVLDADHTGLDEVKDRIVEMLAVRKLLAERAAERTAEASGEGDDAPTGPAEPVDNGRRPGAIVALAGPPGVGKTSLAIEAIVLGQDAAGAGELTKLVRVDTSHRQSGREQGTDDATLVTAARLKANCGDCERAQPCDQLGPAGRVITHRKEPPLRQHHHVQAVLRHVNAAIGKLFHLRIPSLLMRARAQATVRVWKNRLEHQAHSRSNFRGACGLPVATGAGSSIGPRHPSLCCFPDIQGAASSYRSSAARRRRGRLWWARSSSRRCA